MEVEPGHRPPAAALSLGIRHLVLPVATCLLVRCRLEAPAGDGDGKHGAGGVEAQLHGILNSAQCTIRMTCVHLCTWRACQLGWC